MDIPMLSQTVSTRWDLPIPVSYTHLDVYKRQFQRSVCGFHDAVIRGLDYVSGAYVNADKSMYPLADVRLSLIHI